MLKYKAFLEGLTYFYAILYVMVEIERKFLVDSSKLGFIKQLTGKKIRQAYLAERADGTTVRVRQKGNKGYLTVKGPSHGISRTEVEVEIELNALESLFTLCPAILEKIRYEVLFEGKTWEIDVFKGQLEGLIVAEIELNSEDEQIEIPEWVSTEVTQNAEYYNVRLIERLL